MFSYKITTNYEYILFDLYQLSCESNGFGLGVNYTIVKDYCKKYKFDVIEMFRKIKQIVASSRKE